MVMGHTTQKDGKIRTRCDGAIVAIDTGISAYAGHNFSAFELINGDAQPITPVKPSICQTPKSAD